MKIFETIEKGEFLDYGFPDKTIDTMLSRLYFFGDKVLKRYKHIDAFYGNMADKEYRKLFHEADFYWNNYMAPEIYLRLGGIKEADGDCFESNIEEAQDYFVEMACIDDTKNFTKGLLIGDFDAEVINGFIDLLVEKPRQLLIDQKEKLNHISQRGWQSLFEENMDDLRNWIYLAEAYIPRSFADEAVELISKRVKSERYYRNFDNTCLTAVVDNNCDNLLILNGRESFIDIMPPKENWKVADEYWMIVRTIADAYVLGGKELGDSAHGHYKKYRSDMPEAVTHAYEARGALVQAAYRFILGQTELGKRYMDFVLDRVERLK